MKSVLLTPGKAPRSRCSNYNRGAFGDLYIQLSCQLDGINEIRFRIFQFRRDGDFQNTFDKPLLF